MGGVEGMEGAYELEGAMESAHVHICQGKCLFLHRKGLTNTFTEGKCV